ncbi:hypothetical protein [Lutibacter sp.]|uniref:hypothetical protein n=1 Tax=Lutibacter sp. TaxID=1925666 RepID=UPI0025BAE2D3|nr:hypothetical protein [Lutibacter sp.]MCF6167084.1 hypothetical protein [Lutibacter sp.]
MSKIFVLEDFIKHKLKNFDLKLTVKIDGREGVDFVIGDNQLYLQSIDLDTVQRSIKIAKQDLGELREKLFVTLVLIIDKESKVVYLIPSKDLSQSDSNIFIENEVSLMPSLSNWEIKNIYYYNSRISKVCIRKYD